MPPPGIAGAAFLGSGFSTTRVSVVSTRPAMDAAFWMVDRVTFGDLVARVLERRRTGRAMYHI